MEKQVHVNSKSHLLTDLIIKHVKQDDASECIHKVYINVTNLILDGQALLETRDYATVF